MLFILNIDRGFIINREKFIGLLQYVEVARQVKNKGLLHTFSEFLQVLQFHVHFHVLPRSRITGTWNSTSVFFLHVEQEK